MTQTRQDPHLDAMIQAACTAGAKLLTRFHNRDSLLIEYKNPGDLVSLADRESEEMITAILNDAYPHYGVLGEEGSSKSANADGFRWIIDPLDATGNFLNGIPFWAVNIALEQHGSVIAAVTYDAVHDELFSATRGQGAYLNGTAIHTKPTTSLAKAATAVDIGAPPHARSRDFGHVTQQIFTHCAAGSILRCTALCMASIAAGRLDLFAHFGKAKAWDIAPGWLLITEAGGVATDIEQNPLHLEAGSVLCAANQTLYDQFVPFLKAQ
jgi:myo-inositol-1(or 4)-monophosphatase